MSYLLKDLVLVLDGVGPKGSAALADLGIHTLSDLIHFFPARYVDASKPVLLGGMPLGKVAAVKVTIDKVTSGITAKKRLKVVTATAHDAAGAKARLIWYNQPYRAKQLHEGSEILVVGVGESDGKSVSIVAPRVLLAPEVLPLYRRVSQLPSGTIRKLIQQALGHVAGELRSKIPQSALSDEEYVRAVGLLHEPLIVEDVALASKSMALREGWQYFASLWLRTQASVSHESFVIPADAEFIAKVVATLPFTLSPSQKRAIWDAAQDMAGGKVMTRLINGDVGSGKTVVAGVLACLVARAGYRSVLMAPTDLLAQQHVASLQKLFAQTGLRVGQWSRSSKDKESVNADLVVGTQALLYGDAPIENVALRIVDEQHRFGVIQRTAVGGKMAHFLSTTATPIPRTLMLTLLSGVDVSKLSTAPARSTERKTLIVSSVDAYEKMDDEIGLCAERGEQVFVVCPSINPMLVDEDIELSEQGSKRSAEGEFLRLQKRFPKLRIGMVHGKLKTADRNETMAAFAAGSVDILVATTVVEVGVDVPNATLMVIHNAERFGIAQLHQLRGRIGRGEKPGTCYLAVSGKIPERLHAVAESDDGFYLAEIDLEERGAGDLIGVQQSGSIARFSFLDPKDVNGLQELRDKVFTFAESHSEKELLDIAGELIERGAD